MEARFERVGIRTAYFLYLAAIGVIFTYWPLHFAALGMRKDEIGLVFGGRAVVSLFMQPVIGWAAVRFQRPAGMLRLTLWTGALLSLVMHEASGFMVICLLMWLQAVPESGTVPMLDTTIVSRFGSLRYGSFRLWGSAGYGVGVAAFAALVASLTSSEAGLRAIWVAPVLYAGAALAVLAVPETTPVSLSAAASGRLPRDRQWFVFLATCSLHWMAVMCYNIYLSLYCAGRGLAPSVPGYAVAAAIVGEVLALAWAPRLFGRVLPRRVFAACLAASVLRWVLTGLAAEAWQLVALQGLHFASFGLWYASVMRELDHHAAAAPRSLLQSVFAASVFALGGLVAGVVGGRVVQAEGAEASMWLAAGFDAAALILWLVASRSRPPAAAV